MKYSRGDKIVFNPDKTIPVNVNTAETRKDRRIGKISNVHPEEKNPYDIVNETDQAHWVGNDDCIIRKILPRCDECNAKKIYHDKKGYRVCPWCEL